MGGKKASLSGEQRTGANLGPSNCSSRKRAEDAAHAVADMASLMNGMSPELVRKLVNAREAATGIHRAFPEGDQRFAGSESESEDEEEQTNGSEAEEFRSNEGPSVTEAEMCRGLLDDQMDPDPYAALKRAKEEHNFDIVEEMDNADLEFFERIRVVNYLRRIVDNGTAPEEAIRIFKSITETKESSVLTDDAYLEPYIEGDVILTVLESEEAEADEGENFEEIADAVRKSLQASDVLR